MARLIDELDEFLGGMGFELVTLDRGGGRGNRLLRMKIDRRNADDPGRSGVTVDDCARVARALRELLEGREDVPRDFRLEVSSPGVERPLVRPRDYERFAGREVRLKGYGPLAEGRKQLEGTLLGYVPAGDGDEGAIVAVEVAEGRVEVPLSAIAKANLVYDWEDDL